MSNEHVYIARLREWVDLDIPAIENLIDTVSAYDKQGASSIHRAEHSEQELSEEKWKAVENKLKERPIDSQEAKLIAKSIIKSKIVHTIDLFHAYDVILGKVPKNLDPAGYNALEENINEFYCTIDDDDIFLTVNRMFLEVLYLNLDDALRYIASKPYHLMPNCPKDIALRIRAFAESSSTTPSVEIPSNVPLTEKAAVSKKKYKPRGAISAKDAAVVLEISERQVRKWDAGINMPESYPGRGDEVGFRQFAHRYCERKKLVEQARAMNRATSRGKI